MAGFATRTSFAGHADSSAKTNHELTSNLDHQMGAGQLRGHATPDTDIRFRLRSDQRYPSDQKTRSSGFHRIERLSNLLTIDGRLLLIPTLSYA